MRGKMEKWLGFLPIYQKETRMSDRTGLLTLAVMVFNFLLSVLAMFQLWIMVRESAVYGTTSYTTMLQIYLMIAMLEILLLLLLIPALTAGTISGEREKQTLDLLLCSRIRPVDIVMGKLLSAWSTMIVLILTSLPCLSLVYIYGGIRLSDMMLMLIAMGVTTLYAGSISISFSCIMKKTTSSVLLSYIAIVFCLAGTEIILWMVYRFGSVFVGAEAMADGSWMGHWDWMLLWNPAATFASLFNRQVGSISNYFNLSYLPDWLLPEVVTKTWWLPLSLLVQTATAVFCLYLGCRSLDPRHQKR